MFEDAHGLSPDSKLTPKAWSELIATANDPALMQYTISDSDVKGPFLKKLPSKMEALSNLERLSYTDPRQEIAEKFHMSQALLKMLNPGKSLDRGGETIVVTNVANDPPDRKAARIEVDKANRELRVYAEDGSLIFAAPATIGSAEKPAPSGTLKVTSVTHNPTYRYNRALSGISIQRSENGAAVHDQARPQQSGRRRVGRPVRKRLRHPRHARTLQGEQGRVARLCSSDQLGCPETRRDRKTRHSGRIPRTGPSSGDGPLNHCQVACERTRQSYELPMRIPAANTNAPPTTTWKAAARKGVSMYR